MFSLMLYRNSVIRISGNLSNENIPAVLRIIADAIEDGSVHWSAEPPEDIKES